MRRKPQGSRFMQAISRLASMGRRSQQQTIQPSSNSSRVVGAAAGASGSNSSFCGDEADAPQAVRLSHGTAAATTTRADDSSAAATAAAAVQVAAGKLPLSPFVAPGAPLAPQRQLLGQDARLMLYQHSMIRLASSLVRGNSSRNLIDSLVAAEAGKAASKGQAAALDGDAEPEHVLEEPEQAALSGSMQHNGTSQNGTPSRQKGSSWQNRGIRVVARFMCCCCYNVGPGCFCLPCCLASICFCRRMLPSRPKTDFSLHLLFVCLLQIHPSTHPQRLCQFWRAGKHAAVAAGSCRHLCRQAGCGRPGHSAGGATHQPLCRGGVRPAGRHLGAGQVSGQRA